MGEKEKLEASSRKENKVTISHTENTGRNQRRRAIANNIQTS